MKFFKNKKIYEECLIKIFFWTKKTLPKTSLTTLMPNVMNKSNGFCFRRKRRLVFLSAVIMSKVTDFKIADGTEMK